MPQEILLNKKILSIHLTTDKKAIKFVTDQGEIIANAIGDCCSETWIEEIELPVFGLPATVLEVKNISFNEGLEEEKYYSFEIKTDKGNITLSYRNESNGYYGGYLEFDKEYFDFGHFGQNKPNNIWKQIKK
jgi:hypothetical protein